MVSAAASRHPDVQHTSLMSEHETMYAGMAEGGHDPEFDVEIESDDEAMATTSMSAFANLGQMRSHLPLTSP